MFFNQTSFGFISVSETKILFGLIMGFLSVITSIGNILVIYRYRKASMVGNLFIISLACADLIVGSFVMPLATSYAITETWNMSLPLCLIWLSADYTASTASILNLLNLSLDRYWSITTPLKYLGKRTKSRALIMISLAWSLSLLWLVPIFAWPYIFNDSVRYVPSDKCNTEYDKNIIFKVTTAIINFYLPLIVLISINTKIYLVIRSRYRNPIMKYSSAAGCSSQVPKNSSVINYFSDSTMSPSNSYFSTNLKLSRNNSSVKFRRNASSFHTNSVKSFHNFPKKNAAESPPVKLSPNSSVLLYPDHNSFSQYFSFGNLSFKSQAEKTIITSGLHDCPKTFNLKKSSSINLKILENAKKNTLQDFSDSKSHKKSLVKDTLNKNETKLKQNDEKEIVFDKSSESSINSKLTNPVAKSTIKKNSNKEAYLEVKVRKNSVSSTTASNGKLNVPYNQNLEKYQKQISINKEEKPKQKLFMNKQEKAFKQLAAIVIGFTLCFLPYFLVFLVVAMCEECISETVFTASVWLGYLNSTINPFLYAISNKRFFKGKSKKQKQEIRNRTQNVNFF